MTNINTHFPLQHTKEMKMRNTILFFILAFSSLYFQSYAQDSIQIKNIEVTLSEIYFETLGSKSKVRIDSMNIDKKGKSITLHTNLSLSYLPMTDNLVVQITNEIRKRLPQDIQRYRLNILSDNTNIENLVPNFIRTRQKEDSYRQFRNKGHKPLICNISKPRHDIDRGLQNNHIAMWQSHGWYYEQKLARWEWQRARIFQTVEDLYTQSYVLPFLVPMLERAGANVLLPRERDYNTIEIIIDNDDTSRNQYKEINGKTAWKESVNPGFSDKKDFYINDENPFKMGTSRYTETITKGEESVIEWAFDVPKDDEYGVYVSYESFDRSTDNARYTIHHSGGSTTFSVNQQMGGGTWIFLGYFKFKASDSNKITLSNISRKKGEIVSADAVKIGGGMGNIARKVQDISFDNYTFQTSGYPRYTEGSRYWMQWAGVPDSIYNQTDGTNDYTDDFASRGHWVNWLAGGSDVLPDNTGLRIPIDLAFAFHTDAGTYWGDSIVGTLGIYMTHFNNEMFENGKSRWASRDLTQLILTEITEDIRREFEPNWTRRQLWNKSYAEARTPNVPTMLLELLSHQNFADMRYGLDPTFRFTVSRAIYKGMLKFIASQYNRAYTVQPLPVKDFKASFSNDTEVKLTWSPTKDSSEISAKPDKYIVYTRKNDGGFDNGILVDDTTANVSIEKDVIYSFKVEAINQGGRSFPSEILSVSRKSDEKGLVLIVNGFTRLSAPYSFTTNNDSIAGFLGSEDNGVPYLADYHFIDNQHEFRRVIPWMDDDAAGFGDSYANYETTKIAGNTFDFPYSHGLAFAQNGYSFVSQSASSVSIGDSTQLQQYDIIDWILGKQKQSVVGRGAFPAKYKTFTKEQQEVIAHYLTRHGGNIVVSGAYVGSDIWQNPYADTADKMWGEDILNIKLRNSKGAINGEIKSVASPLSWDGHNFKYYNSLNSDGYVVENPDAIESTNKNGFTVFRYPENNLSAGVFNPYETGGSACILGFPIESIRTEKERNLLIQLIVGMINQNNTKNK